MSVKKSRDQIKPFRIYYFRIFADTLGSIAAKSNSPGTDSHIQAIKNLSSNDIH